MSLGEVNEPDRYPDRPRLASSEGEPGLEATNRIRLRHANRRGPGRRLIVKGTEELSGLIRLDG